MHFRKTTLKAIGHPVSLCGIAMLHSLALTHCGLHDIFDVLAYFAYIGIAWFAVFLGRGTFNQFSDDDNAELVGAFEKGCMLMGFSCLLNIFFVLTAVIG